MKKNYNILIIINYNDLYVFSIIPLKQSIKYILSVHQKALCSVIQPHQVVESVTVLYGHLTLYVTFMYQHS